MTYSRRTPSSRCPSLPSLFMERNTRLNTIFKTSTPLGTMTPIFSLLQKTRSRLLLSFLFNILLISFLFRLCPTRVLPQRIQKPKSLKSRFEGTATMEEVTDTTTAKVQPHKQIKTQTGSMKDEPSTGEYLFLCCLMLYSFVHLAKGESSRAAQAQTRAMVKDEGDASVAKGKGKAAALATVDIIPVSSMFPCSFLLLLMLT